MTGIFFCPLMMYPIKKPPSSTDLRRRLQNTIYFWGFRLIPGNSSCHLKGTLNTSLLFSLQTQFVSLLIQPFVWTSFHFPLACPCYYHHHYPFWLFFQLSLLSLLFPSLFLWLLFSLSSLYFRSFFVILSILIVSIIIVSVFVVFIFIVFVLLLLLPGTFFLGYLYFFHRSYPAFLFTPCPYPFPCPFPASPQL